MSSETNSPITILLVEDDPLHATLAQAALQPPPEGSDWRLTHVTTLGAACALAEPPDLVLLDLSLPDAKGLDTLRRLRERFAFVPVVALTGEEDPRLEAAALDAGAQDFVGREEMTARTLRRVVRYAMERHRAQRALLELSTHDELTGLLNRRGFFMAAQSVAQLADRAGRAFVVLLADLDGPGLIGDAHYEPDVDALQEAAWILTHTFRSADIVARIGGDRFAILAPDAPPETIEIMIRRIAKWQDERNRESAGGSSVSLSVAGVAWTPAEPRTLDMLISEADMAVYAAKRRALR
jgi:diguanylate cyclase (GGDEF)-like protein